MGRRKNEGVCVVQGCADPNKVRGYCGFHYNRLLRGTDMLAPRPVRGGRLPKAQIEYRAAHNRIDVQRGKARTYFCADCNEQAEQWSLMATAENVVISQEAGSIGMRYSTDVLEYEARCRKCHVAYDQALRVAA